MRNVAKSDTFRPVATPGNHMVAPLLVASPVVEAWIENAGKAVESRMLEALRNKTMELRKVIHSMYSRLNPSAYVMPINIEEKSVSKIVDWFQLQHTHRRHIPQDERLDVEKL